MANKEQFGHSAVFTKCVSDLRSYRYKSEDRLHRWTVDICRVIATLVEKAERFFVPSDFHILDGKELTEEIKEIARLPFECIAILTEQEMKGSPIVDMKPGSIPRITVAFSRDFNNKNRLIPNVGMIKGEGFYLLDTLNYGGTWFPGQFMAYGDISPNQHGVRLDGLRHESFPNVGLDPATEMRDDFTDVLNLCVMLNLQNVKTEQKVPPLKLQAKRIKCNRLPLLDYRVLVVDNERWDTAQRHRSGDGSGVRTHMRRGHIRRLHGSERRIWVRAALIGGSRPGQIDKEYSV